MMWQKPKPWKCAAVAFLLLILASVLVPPYAQVRRRPPIAYLRGADSQPLAGVPVRFRDTKTGAIIWFTTDAQGSFRWEGLKQVPGFWPPRLPPRYELQEYAVVKPVRQSMGSGGLILAPRTATAR